MYAYAYARLFVLRNEVGEAVLVGAAHLGHLLAVLVHLEGGHGSDAGALGHLKKNEEEGESGSDTVCANAVVLVIVWASAGDVLLVCP